MPEYLAQWLNQTWIIIVAVVGGITMMWKFRGTLNEITKEIKQPITDINQKLDNLEENGRLEKAAVLSLQRKSLLDSCQFYLNRGYATLEEKSTMDEQYASYHDLGGNSFITDIVHQVEVLPISPVEKKKKRKTKKEENLF